MANIKSYSTTPADNTSLFPEGMARNLINNNMRQVQSDLRGTIEELPWFEFAAAITWISGTQFRVSGDVTGIIAVDDRMRAVGSLTGTIYGAVSAVSFSSPNTTITVVWDSGSMSNETLNISVSRINVGNALPAIPESKLETSLQTLLDQFRYRSGIGCGQLQYVSATQIKLAPYNGELVSFPDKTVLDIPSGGITADYDDATIDGTTGQTLAVNTNYNVYCYNNSGSLALGFTTTARATDTTTGIEIISGQTGRVLVGKIRTNGSSQFTDSASARYVATWHNRRPVEVLGEFTADRSRNSSTYGEIDQEIRGHFLSWGDVLAVHYAGTAFKTSGSATVSTALNLNNSDIFAANATPAISSNGGTNVSVSGVTTPSEGAHFITLHGNSADGSTTTWSSTDGTGKLSAVVMI